MYYLYDKCVLLAAALSLSIWRNAQQSVAYGLADEFPCPLPEDIEPCTCTYDSGDSTLNLDCSHIASSDQLSQVFQAEFPVSTFNNFTIDSNSFITEIKNNTFGAITFEEVWISFSALETIQINAFAGMESILKRLYLYHNKIRNFPFLVLDKYTVLEELSLISNGITYVPSIHSISLMYLELGLNPLEEIPVNPFTHLPKLRDLKMEATGLSELKPGLFVFNTELEFISLWGNHLRHLETYWFSFPGFDTVRIIVLNHNDISVIDQGTFNGVSEADIYLEYNNIDTMEESVWMHVLQGKNTIYLRGNHMQCDCKMAWLVWERPLLELLVEAKCTNGHYLADLDPDFFSGCNTTTATPITTWVMD